MSRGPAPRVLRSWNQQISGKNLGAKERAFNKKALGEEKLGRELALPPRPSSVNQFIGFFGTLTNGKELEEQFVMVLAGEGAPQPIGGWAEWLKVPRPQRVAMTVLQGYPPMEMEIPIRFEAVLLTQGRQNVEQEIQKLEWMAGRSRIKPGTTHGEAGGVFTGHPGHDALGDSPLVEIFTTDGTQEIALIPRQFQGMQWVITKIDFDKGAIRDAGGDRLRQFATVTAMQHVSSPGTSFDSPSVRAQARQTGAGKGRTVIVTGPSNNEIVKIAIIYTGTIRTVNEILKANKSRNPSIGTNPWKKLKVGTKVFIPFNAEHRLGLH